MRTYVIVAIDPITADELRAAHTADVGPVTVADEHPGYPCRQCLRDADVGDELILVSHDPFDGDSPYRSASPIFLHRVSCAPAASTDELPDQLTRRLLSVRAFDARRMMIDAAVIDGSQLGPTIDRLLANDAAHHLHVHNATRGCWAARVDRVG